MPPTDDLTDEDLSDEDLTEDDLADEDLTDEDLTDEDAGLLTEDIDDLVPLVRPPRLDDLVDDADIEVLVDPEIPLDLVIDELLTPALPDADPMPLLLPEPVVDKRGV